MHLISRGELVSPFLRCGHLVYGVLLFTTAQYFSKSTACNGKQLIFHLPKEQVLYLPEIEPNVNIVTH